MPVLLTEDDAKLLTEDGLYNLLIEPVVAEFGFPSRFGGVAVIYKIGAGWETDLGRGPVRSEVPKRLEEMALKAGAARIEYNI